jgi:hypothetical protein
MDESDYYDNSPKQVNPALYNQPYITPMQNYAGNINTLTNPSDDLYEIELKLKGLSDNGKGEIKQIGDRLVNDIGVNEILTCARGAISQVTIMGNLEQKDIDIIRDYLADELVKLLMINRIRYGMIYPESTRDLIYDTIIIKAVITMKRSLQEGERRFWKGSQQEIRMTNDNKQSSQQGGFSKLMGWLK